MGVTAASAALLQIVFQCIIILSDALDCLYCGGAQLGTAQIGVQHDAGRIDDRAQVHGCFLLDQTLDLIAEGVRLDGRFLSGKDGLTQRVNDLANRFGEDGVLAGEGG